MLGSGTLLPAKRSARWRVEHNDSINSVAISPDGKWIATGSADGTVRVSELAGGSRVVEMHQQENVHTLAFDPRDEMCSLGISGKTVTVWKLPDGHRLFELAHEEQVNAAEFSPDGSRIVTASDDRSCRLWDAKTGQPIGDELKHETEVRNAFFSSDGELIASLAGERLIIWSVKDKPIQKYVLPHRRRISCARFSPDNFVIFSGTEDGVVQAWNLLDGKTLGEPIREETAIVNIGLDKEGKRLLVTTGNASARSLANTAAKSAGRPLCSESWSSIDQSLARRKVASDHVRRWHGPLMGLGERQAGTEIVSA